MLLRIFTEPQQGASYDDQLTVAKKTEECGFDAFFRSDHYLVMGDKDPLPGPTDSWVTLAGLARETERIRLGTLVTSATFRNPGVLAISVAQVDQMSGGRVELGLGAGWFQAEHEAYGLEFPGTKTRFDILTEQLSVITGLWKTPVGDRFDYDGAVYQVKDSPGLPKPVQQPHPPIIIGGKGRNRTPRLAATFAAEFNANFEPVDEVKGHFDRVLEVCDEVGRDRATMKLSVANTVCVGRDEAELKRRADNIGRDLDEMRANAIAGTPAEVVDKLGQHVEIGASTAYLQVLDLADLDHLELIAAEVMPQLR
jgi:F420-dependent oxidoreductase-like protein